FWLMTSLVASLFPYTTLFRSERLFLGRHKFYHFRVWYRDELSGYLKDILLDSTARNRPYFRRAGLEAMIEDHIGGRRNHTLEIQDRKSTRLNSSHLVTSYAVF